MRRKLFLKGIHYKNDFVYKIITGLKLLGNYKLRYKIAAQYIKSGETVLDVCSGSGDLREFLPQNCEYIGLDASKEFVKKLNKKGIQSINVDLHKEPHSLKTKVDVTVMIISLYQFRDTTLHSLLPKLKEMTKKVVIVEEVLEKKRVSNSIVQRIIDYLCATDFYIPLNLFDITEFTKIMEDHSFFWEKRSSTYYVGIYEEK
jgi:cyclopropane fatty-acyl-phospholipid synthase-like methyltransferase